MKWLSRLTLTALIAALVWVPLSGTNLRAQGKKLKVVASITIIQDIAKNVAGDYATVEVLVPNNGDVHEFDPSPRDVQKIADADVVLVNGLLLEGFIDKLIKESGTKAKIVVVSKGLGVRAFGTTEITPRATPAANDLPAGIIGMAGQLDCAALTSGKEGEAGSCDPHLWQDVKNAIGYANNIRDALIEADPTNTEGYKANTAAYIAKLETLDATIVTGINNLPADSRKLVTNHDALGYFAARYGLQIVGVVLAGGTTGQEPTPKDIARLIETIKAQKIKAVFLENVSNDSFAQQIAREAGVKVVQGVYTDALGAESSSGATYLDMMTSNLKLITEALK